MFGKSRKPTDASLPPPLTVSSQQRFFEAFGLPQLKLARAQAIAVLHWAVTLGLVVLLIVLLPLKTTEYRFVSEDKLTGQVRQSDLVARKFEPSELNKLFEARRWVAELLTVDPALLLANQAHVTAMVRGKAVGELRSWQIEDKPSARLVADPQFTRTVNVLSSNLLSDGGADIAIIRVLLTETGRDGLAKRAVKVVTLHYNLLPPATLEEAERTNAIGFTVTHFSISDESKAQ
ncbi:VirB8/TrbF family protein [Parachitinimonas caeni]|uniref:VirB8/TrbF family protein n=1 Tax=Parachitinimonas caeni TaxID=3031301 RepID=A0ABT7E1S9_9NEIS|nr:VirB8/TrbF family protein [Parachitinimonas caeni]MDK2126268.1 VirB8/TrbF family protein [Parachitinimonas caeni]